MKKNILFLICLIGVQFISAQNVGIGIANPQDQLHVQNALRIEGSFPTLKFYQGITYAASIEQNGSNTIFSNRKIGKLIFNSNLINRLMIIENGFIGIDNSAPLDRLHIKNGSMRIEHTTAPKLKLFQGSTFASSFEQNGDNTAIKNLETGNLSLYTDAQERMTIDSIGNVGLNINTPQDLLHLKDGHLRIQHSSIPQFKMYRAGTFSASIEQNGSNTFFRNREAGSLTLFTNNLPRASINSAGLMGIGTTTPADMLHLKGGVARIETTSNPELKLYQGTSHMASFAQNAFNTRIQNFTAGNIALFTLGLERLTVKSTGETGIGTNNPLDKLHIKNGALRIENSFPAINLYQSAVLASKIEHNGNNLLIRNLEAGSMSLQTNNQAVMTLTATGDAGVGTTGPSQKLDIEGKIEIGNDSAPPTEGAMRYNSDRKDMEFYNGTKWVSISNGETFSKPKGLDDAFSPFHGSPAGVCLDNNGDAVVVWTASPNVYISEYRNGTWIHPIDTSDHINPSGSGVLKSGTKVKCDAQGNIIVVWIVQPTGGENTLYKSEYRGGNWAHPADLNDFFGLSGEHVVQFDMDMSPSGNIVITWSQERISTLAIYMSEYRNGTWTHPGNFNENINIDATSLAGLRPQVSVGDTISIITWTQFHPVEFENVQFMSYYDNGTWTHPGNIDQYISPATLRTAEFDVAVNNHRQGIIVYEGGAAGTSHIFKSTYLNGTWTHPSTSNSHISTPIDLDPLVIESATPRAAIDDSGNMVIVYQNLRNLYKQDFRFGGPITVFLPFTVHANDQEGFIPFELEMSDSGNALISWTHQQQDWLYASRFDIDGGTWMHPHGESDHLNPDFTQSFIASGAINDNNEAIIVWSQQLSTSPTTESRVFMSRF